MRRCRCPDVARLRYELTYPEDHVLVRVNIDKFLARHFQDDPQLAIPHRDVLHAISGRVDRAKKFWIENANRRGAVFEPTLALFYEGRLVVENGRHRLLAMKELGCRDAMIEVPAEQAWMFRVLA